MMAAASITTDTLRGSVETVFYASPRFSAGRLRTAAGDLVSFAGALMVRQHDPVVLEGSWERHPKFGRQFKVARFSFDQRLGPDGLAHYLASHPDLKGIGPVKARRIALAFEDDFDRIIEEEPERVAEVAKLPMEAVQALRSEWLRRRTMNAALTWLASFELTHHQVTVLVEKFGNAVVTVLKTDPYLLVREVSGFGFKRVDLVARKMGTPKEHPSRIRAGVVHCVAERLDQGDCWVDYQELLELGNALLVMDVPDSRERIERALDGLIDDGTLACVSLGGRFLVAQPRMHDMERDLAGIFSTRRLRPNPHLALLAEDNLLAEAGARLNEPQRRALLAAARHNLVLVSGGAGSGKAQPLDAKILTATGWRPMGDIKIGDQVIGSNGRPCNVVGLYPQGERDVFRVTMTDGASTECCDEHLWLTRSQKDRDRRRPGSVKPLREIRRALVNKSGKRNHWIPIVEPAEFTSETLPLDPYALGLLLGDGCFRVPNGCGFSKAGMEVVDALQAALPEGAHLSYRDGFEYRIVGDGTRGGNPVVNALRDLGLAGKGSPEKFVPDVYKFTTADNRLALLQGLLDTDGSTNGHGVEFSTTSPRLAEDVLFLVRSLGGTASLRQRQT